MKVYTHDVRAKVQAERDETEAKAERWECDELDRMIEEAKADIESKTAQIKALRSALRKGTYDALNEIRAYPKYNPYCRALDELDNALELLDMCATDTITVREMDRILDGALGTTFQLGGLRRCR